MPAPALTISHWLLLLLALPVLWLGEWLVAHGRLLARYSIPAPVVGGLLVAALVLVWRVAGWGEIQFVTGTATRAWTWLVTAGPEWNQSPVKSANLPFLAAFFACVGLSASWRLVRSAGRQVVIFLLAVTGLAVLQNVTGIALAKLLGVSPLLGLVCSSMSLTGGHATTLGFAAEFERAGLAGAQTLGTAAATFGLVAGAILAGPIGNQLIRRHALNPPNGYGKTTDAQRRVGWVQDLGLLVKFRGGLVRHLILLAVILKLGAWISHLLQGTGLSLPVFVGTMVAGVIARNVLELARVEWFEPELTQALGSVLLSVFLVTAMMSLNLHELSFSAGPMLLILATQTIIMAAFAWWITFPVMGKNYDAAIMAAGHCGFGLGSTTTAVAGLKALVETTGPSPRAFLVVPLVGGFLVDLANAANLTLFVNLFGR